MRCTIRSVGRTVQYSTAQHSRCCEGRHSASAPSRPAEMRTSITGSSSLLLVLRSSAHASPRHCVASCCPAQVSNCSASSGTHSHSLDFHMRYGLWMYCMYLVGWSSLLALRCRTADLSRHGLASSKRKIEHSRCRDWQGGAALFTTTKSST